MSDDIKSGIKYLDLADDYLDGISDPELLILKSHLIIEAALRESVAANMRHPRFLEDANLRFYQVLNLAKAMFYSVPKDKERAKDIELIWDSLEALNTLRNRLAHRLEQEDITQLLKRTFIISPYESQGLDHPDVRGFIHMGTSKNHPIFVSFIPLESVSGMN